MDAVSVQEFARARAQLYELLAAIFDGDVEVLQRAIGESAFTQLAGVLPAEFDTCALDRDDLDAEALRIGYDNLFVVPGPHYVPPFASAHLDDPREDFDSDSKYHDAGEAGELFGASAEEVATYYDRTGFRPERGDGIPDHVAAEFEFMAALADREADALGDPEDDPATVAELRDLQRAVLSHLGWVEPFADEVADADTQEGVFAALAGFAVSYVDWDATELDARD